MKVKFGHGLYLECRSCLKRAGSQLQAMPAQAFVTGQVENSAKGRRKQNKGRGVGVTAVETLLIILRLVTDVMSLFYKPLVKPFPL